MRSLLVLLLLGLLASATASRQGVLQHEDAGDGDASGEAVIADPVEPVIASKAQVIESIDESGDKELLKDTVEIPKVEDPLKQAEEEGMIVGKADTITKEEATATDGEILTEKEVTARGEEVVESVVVGDPDPMVVKCEFRVRKEWRDMKSEKQKLFLRAVQQLKEEGTYDELVDLFDHNFYYSHGGSGYLPWNRKFLLKFEHALRDLGGEFACLSVPYWDWTQDAGREDVPGIFCDETGFGHLQKGCLQSGPFEDWRDPTDAGDEGKITREPAMPLNVAGAAAVKHAISTFDAYGQTCALQGIRQVLEGTLHANILLQIGGTIATRRGPADPLWFLVHAYVDRLWAMWQDCHDYDEMQKEDITTEVYFEQNYDTADGKNVDATLDAGMPGFGDAATPRNMHNIFELGYGYAPDKWDESQSFHDNCNWDWFVAEESEDSEELIEVSAVKRSLKKHSNQNKAQAHSKAVKKAFAKIKRTAHKALNKVQNDVVTVLNECFEEELVEAGNDCEQAMLSVVQKECEILPEEEAMRQSWAEENLLHVCDGGAADTFPTLCARFNPTEVEFDYMSEEDEYMQEYMEESGIAEEDLSSPEDVAHAPDYQSIQVLDQDVVPDQEVAPAADAAAAPETN